MKVARQFEIAVGHRLSNYEGKCKFLHGHNYIGELIIDAPDDAIDERGMLIDFSDLKEIIVKKIERKFDHKFLLNKNDKENVKIFKPAIDDPVWFIDSFVWVDYNPTVENIVFDMQEIAQKVITEGRVIIKLYETSNSYACTE